MRQCSWLDPCVLGRHRDTGFCQPHAAKHTPRGLRPVAWASLRQGQMLALGRGAKQEHMQGRGCDRLTRVVPQSTMCGALCVLAVWLRISSTQHLYRWRCGDPVTWKRRRWALRLQPALAVAFGAATGCSAAHASRTGTVSSSPGCDPACSCPLLVCACHHPLNCTRLFLLRLAGLCSSCWRRRATQVQD